MKTGNKIEDVKADKKPTTTIICIPTEFLLFFIYPRFHHSHITNQPRLFYILFQSYSPLYSIRLFTGIADYNCVGMFLNNNGLKAIKEQ